MEKQEFDEYRTDYYMMNVRRFAKVKKVPIEHAALEINRFIGYELAEDEVASQEEAEPDKLRILFYLLVWAILLLVGGNFIYLIIKAVRGYFISQGVAF